MAKEIMKTHDLSFCDRPNLLLSTIWSYNATDIIFGSVVNLTKKIYSLTNGIVARACFGKRNKHQQEFLSAIDETVSLLGGFCIADLYPSIKILERVNWAKTKIEKVHREIDMILQDIIDEHKSIHKEANKDEDLVDVLLKIQQESDNSLHPLTDDNLKPIIQDMFAAGSETSSGVVLWAMSEIVKNPKLPNKTKNEDLDMTESFGISLRRKYDLCVIPIIRRHP
ncbi:cytochrome P450 71D10 [Trifolium repens]|nr:cytochrome P450 71D10 [Trifolium repens]